MICWPVSGYGIELAGEEQMRELAEKCKHFRKRTTDVSKLDQEDMYQIYKERKREKWLDFICGSRCA